MTLMENIGTFIAMKNTAKRKAANRVLSALMSLKDLAHNQDFDAIRKLAR
jgi:hypothetical protein